MKNSRRNFFPHKFQSLEILRPIISSLWKILLVAALSATQARAQEAVSPIEMLRQSREQVAAANLQYALALAKAAVEADPSFVDGWKQQGRVEMLLGKSADAFKSFDTVVKLHPTDPDVPVWRLWLMLDAGYARDTATRLSQLADAELIKLGDPMVARTLTALLQRDFNDDAAKLATRWVKIATNEDSLVAASAFVLLAGGDTTGAVSALEKIKTTSAKELSANAWLRVGRVRAKANDQAGAKAAYTKALEIIPGWGPAEKELNPPPPKK